VECQRPLKVRGDLVGIPPAQIFSDDDKALDRRAGVARISCGDRNPVGRGGKRRLRFAVAEAPVADDVVDRGGARIDGRRQRTVGDLDRFERVLGPIAVAGDNHGDRLALVAHAAGGEAPMLDRRPDGGGKGPGPAPGVFTGDDALDTRHR